MPNPSSPVTFQAQDRLVDPEDSSPITCGVKLLASIARSLRRKRSEAGALTLASAEVKITLNETHDPMDVKGYELRETNSLVEEFMLLGNIWVGQRITEAFPRCALLRRHPAPPIQAFDQLLAAAKAVNVELKVGSSKELADSLDLAVVASIPYLNKLLRILATRCMMQVGCLPDTACASLALTTLTVHRLSTFLLANLRHPSTPIMASRRRFTRTSRHPSGGKGKIVFLIALLLPKHSNCAGTLTDMRT